MKTSVPLYHHLKNVLMQHIQEEEWAPGELIPSEPELARQYQVSRTTVRQAVGDLVSAGYLVRQQGKGTFVARRSPTLAASALYGFAEELRQRGHEVSVRVLDIAVVPCPEEVAKVLGLATEQATPVIHVSRTAHADDVCMFHETSYLLPPLDLSSDELAQKRDVFNNIYGFFEQNGVVIGLGRQSVRATLGTTGDATLLGIQEGDPLLVVHRVTQDVTGTPVEWSQVRYPAHLYEYQINLHR